MKILYAIQGCGNGHISRSLEVIPYLEKWGSVDILLSGTQWQIPIPQKIKFKKHGLFYISNTRGGIHFISSLKQAHLLEFIKDIKTLPVHLYDIIISDCEPISAWACYLNKKRCIALSNQASFFSPKIPRPANKSLFMESVIKRYAYCTEYIGYHYEKYDTFITTPIIKKKIRNATKSDAGHITVYLPAYDPQKLAEHFSTIPGTNWEVFSPRVQKAYTYKNVLVEPIITSAYEKSILSCHGIISAAGFQATSEALYLGKKMLIIPHYHQYEQWCNAAALEKMGITILESIKKDFVERVRNWLDTAPAVHRNYPDNAQEIAQTIVKKFGGGDGS